MPTGGVCGAARPLPARIARKASVLYAALEKIARYATGLAGTDKQASLEDIQMVALAALADSTIR